MRAADRWLSPAQEERGRRRLAFLLKQAEVFQHFAPVTADKEKKKCGPSLPHPVHVCSSAAALFVEAGKQGMTCHTCARTVSLPASMCCWEMWAQQQQAMRLDNHE